MTDEPLSLGEDRRAPIAPNLDPRRIIPQAELSYRRTALEHATRFVGQGRPKEAVDAAILFEAYLREGDTIPYNLGERTSAMFREAGMTNLADTQRMLDAIERALPDPLASNNIRLPVDLVQVAAGASAERLFVVQLVLAERERQVRKGYDVVHDDGHDSGELADEAARAILCHGSVPYEALPGVGWVRHDGDRVAEIVQGVALAVAEVERLLRRAAAAEERTHGCDSTVDDDLPEAATGRPGTVA